MTTHLCEVYTSFSGYGRAIERCWQITNGELWVDNGEYASQVSYCPFCGYKAQVEAKEGDFKHA